MGVQDLDLDALLAETGDDGGNDGGDGGTSTDTDDDDKGAAGAGGEGDKGEDKGSSEGNDPEPSKETETEIEVDSRTEDIKSEISSIDEKIAKLKEDDVFKYPDDWEPETYKQLLEVSDKRNQLNKEIAEAEAQKRSLEDEDAKISNHVKLVENFNKEIDYLVKSGRMPKVVDSNNPDDPGQARMKQVREFIISHNNKVKETGSGYPITHIELGLDLLEAKEKLEGKDDEDKKRKEEEMRKKRGALIGKGTGAKGSETQSRGYTGGGLDSALSDALTELE